MIPYYLVILISAIISMVLGSLWYSPILFGKQWIKLMGISKKDMGKNKNKGMVKSYTVLFISSLVTIYVLSMFTSLLGASTFLQGMLIGFWIWLGFFATTMLGSVLWEKKPFSLYAINVSYHLVNLLIIGGILAVWD